MTHALHADLKRGRLLRRLIWLGPLAVLCAAGLTFLVAEVAGGATGRPAANIVLAWLAITWITFAGAADTVRVALLPDPVVTLDESGILDHRIQATPLPWKAVSRIELRENAGEPVLMGVWSDSVDATLKRMPLWGYFGVLGIARSLARPFRFAPISVDLASLNVPPQRIRETVRAHWGEPEERSLVPKALEGRIKRGPDGR